MRYLLKCEKIFENTQYFFNGIPYIMLKINIKNAIVITDACLTITFCANKKLY